MIQEPYTDIAYYKENNNGMIPEEELEKWIKQASRHIDTLTYNRIVGRGISSLTDFQRETVQDVCCQMANFEYANEDMINMVLKSYSINGTSMQFGESWNLKVQNGVAIQRDVYEQLCQTDLCNRTLGR